METVLKLEPKEFSILKLAEELAELQEVLLKVLTKPKGALEDLRLERLIEELGDVKFRTMVVSEKLGITKKVNERVLDKTIETAEACRKRY